MSNPLAKYKLSNQEQKVLILTMGGHQDKEVADELGIKLDTVRVYWKRIRAKTDRSTRAEVIALVASETTRIELEAAQKENERLLSEIVRRRVVEEELAIYRDLFSATCVGLAVEGGDETAILRLNQAFAELHGYKTDELIGRSVEDLFAHPKIKSDSKRKRKNSQEERALSAEKHLRKDGTTFSVLKQITPIGEGFRVHTVIDVEQILLAKTADEVGG